MGEMNLFCFITNLAITVFCGVFLPVIPLLTRKAFLFGVKVPESAQEHPESKALKKRYIITCLLGMCGLLALDVIQFVIWPNLTLIAICYFPLLIAVIQTFAFVSNWKRAVKLKAENNWNVSGIVYAQSRSSHSRGNLSQVPWGYYVISLILIIVSAIVILIHYPSLPDPMPTHFDINMNPDAWSAKSVWVVLAMPFVNLGLTAIMAAVAATIVKARLQISPENPALSFAQHRLYRKWMGHGMGILTLELIAGMGLMGFMSIWPELNIPFNLMLLIMLLPIVPLLVIPFRIGQGGCKLKPKITEADTLAAGYQSTNKIASIPGCGDDKYWVLGMFYHNPDDSAILVEDRFGGNIGFNYARTGVKIGAAIFVIALIGLYVWFTPLLLSIT